MFEARIFWAEKISIHGMWPAFTCMDAALVVAKKDRIQVPRVRGNDALYKYYWCIGDTCTTMMYLHVQGRSATICIVIIPALEHVLLPCPRWGTQCVDSYIGYMYCARNWTGLDDCHTIGNTNWILGMRLESQVKHSACASGIRDIEARVTS